MNNNIRTYSTREKKGWVYVITNNAMPNIVKIGFTYRKPEERAYELGRGNSGAPLPYKVKYCIFTDFPYKVEQKVHSKLRNKRVGKEWFKVSPEHAVMIIKEIAEDINKSAKEKYVDIDKKVIEEKYKIRKATMILDKIFEKIEKNIQDEYGKRKKLIANKHDKNIEIFISENSPSCWDTFFKWVIYIFGFLFLLAAIGNANIRPASIVFLIVLSSIISYYIREAKQESEIDNLKKSKSYIKLLSKKKSHLKQIEEECNLKLASINALKKEYVNLIKTEKKLMFICPYCNKKNFFNINKLNKKTYIHCGICGKRVYPDELKDEP